MKKIKKVLKSSTNKYDIYCNLFLPDRIDENSIDKLVIACHGFGGDKESSAILLLAQSITLKGFSVIALDFPGHGESKDNGEEFLVKNCINDINDVETYYKNINDNMDINFFGTSYGAYAILLKLNSSNREYNSIVLRCPAIRMKDIFEKSILNGNIEEIIKNKYVILGYERKMKVTLKYYNELKENNIFNIYKSNNKILIIHGTQDDVAPLKDVIDFKNKFKDQIILKTIEGADHRFKKAGEIEKVIKIANEYFSRK